MTNDSSPSAAARPDAEFRAHLAEGRLMLQRFRASGRPVLYPRLYCPETGEADYEWVEASGEGTVYATSVVRQRPEAGEPYNVALIDLAEGPRVMSRVIGVSPEEVRIGMTVAAEIDLSGAEPVLLFKAPGGTS